MTQDAARRAAIQARCEAATPGEWTCQPDADPPWWYVEDAQERLVGDWMKPADAAFIAAARADVPDLLAALTAAEAANARLRQALEHYASADSWEAATASEPYTGTWYIGHERNMRDVYIGQMGDGSDVARTALGEAAPAVEETTVDD